MVFISFTRLVKVFILYNPFQCSYLFCDAILVSTAAYGLLGLDVRDMDRISDLRTGYRFSSHVSQQGCRHHLTDGMTGGSYENAKGSLDF